MLLEIADGLAERTQRQVQCLVDTKPAPKGRFVHDGFLFVPQIAYRYPLFRVEERGDPYPVALVGDGVFEKPISSVDEAALKENLRLLFNSDVTKRTVLQLLDLLQGAGTP